VFTNRGFAETELNCLARNSRPQFYAVVATWTFVWLHRVPWATQTFAEFSSAAKRLKLCHRPWWMRNFLGLVMMMGFVKKERQILIVLTGRATSCIIFLSILAWHRFQQVSTYLHFNNAERRENTNDELYKIRQVWSLIVERWCSMYNLGEAISIDVGMIKWREHLAFIAYQKR